LVCLTLQPAWLNAIWFLLLYLLFIVDLTLDSGGKTKGISTTTSPNKSRLPF
jgi:hypothetical protein